MFLDVERDESTDGSDGVESVQVEPLVLERSPPPPFLAEARPIFSRTRVNRFAKVRVALGDPKVRKKRTRV